MILCPECETDLDVEEEEVDEGEVISCPECGTDFEVVTTSPLELKAVEGLGAIHTAQAIHYLKVTGHHLALLINFNVPNLIEGLKRVIL